MKTTSFLLGAFLIAAAGGCNSAYYGPSSPDFYPSDTPPFTNSAAPTLAPQKAVAATPASATVTVAQAKPAASAGL